MTNFSQVQLAIKIDVDTERGTRLGVPQLAALLKDLEIPATFFFSLGPDNTGRALKRIFRRGFLAKVQRTSVLSTYGIRTLLNGVLLPGPHIGNRHSALLRNVKDMGFEVGIHAYDHTRWQDGVAKMNTIEIGKEFKKAQQEFQRVFAESAKTAAAPGWQANAKTFAVYDEAKLLYGSDCRGKEPFFPRIDGKTFNTLQIPTTLPTLDELLGLPDFPLISLINYYSSLLQTKYPNVLTIHAELEGMKYFTWFKDFLSVFKSLEVNFCDLTTIAQTTLVEKKDKIPILVVSQGKVLGRSGTLATIF